MYNNRHCQKGFTLIEMLIAMAIFSALIAVLMMGFRQGLILWDKSQHQSKEWLDYEFRYRLLDTLFSQAVISDDEYAKGMFAPYFKGNKTSVRLMSAAPIMDMPGRVRPIALKAIQQDDQTWTLRYREGYRYSDPGRGLRWKDEWVDLLNQLKSIQFLFEAPAFPLPQELRGEFLSQGEKLIYRDVAEWKVQYDTYQSWKYPTQIKLNFVDINDIPHQWLFVPPRWPDAWTMGVYSHE